MIHRTSDGEMQVGGATRKRKARTHNSRSAAARSIPAETAYKGSLGRGSDDRDCLQLRTVLRRLLLRGISLLSGVRDGGGTWLAGGVMAISERVLVVCESHFGSL